MSRHVRPAAGILRGALAGGFALGFATTSYYGADVLFDGSASWGVASRFWLIAGVLIGRRSVSSALRSGYAVRSG